MHQPFYKNTVTGIYELPWVRLHGTKDYYDMVSILNDFPDVHQTFNLVPSLLEQIIDYAEGRGKDRFLILSATPPAELTDEDRLDITKYFFMANYDNMILPFARYRELLNKRGHYPSDESLKWINFTEQEIFDLQVWFNLAWFDPLFRESNNIVSHLIKKDRNFTEIEKLKLLDFQKSVMGMIIPEYRKLADKGNIEITTTPYYHPIMPLVYNSDIAKIGMPDVALPERRYSYPEDVREQVERAIEQYKSIFGRTPRGMWPSEGSVSEEILPILADNGISWIATDEEILRESFNFAGESNRRIPGALYKPYSLNIPSGDMSIIFRDHVLSDLIGFVYSKWNPLDAVNNFMARLHGIRERLADQDGHYMISVILDGENAWEYYRNDGRDFLKALYERLSEDENVKSVTVSEFLEIEKNRPRLNRLFPGSWINHNFGIWIGHEEDNKAWDLLHDTRDALINHEKENPDDENLAAAWTEIYIAEGSDWNWWYGDDHSSGIDELFDRLYRTHLANVYRLIGKSIPHSLNISILKKKHKKITPKVEPVYSITPIIDGRNSNYFEWISAGIYEFGTTGDAMHQVTKIISRLYYGYDENNVYFRIDATQPLVPVKAGTNYHIDIHFISPVSIRIRITIQSSGAVSAECFREDDKHNEHSCGKIRDVAVDEIVEIAIPRTTILPTNDTNGGAAEMYLKFSEGDIEMERAPKAEPLLINIAAVDADALRWFV